MNAIKNKFDKKALCGQQVLIVDNDCDSRNIYQHLLNRNGAIVNIASSVKDAINIMGWFCPNILICEMKFVNERVSTLIQRTRDIEVTSGRHIPIITSTTTYVPYNSLREILGLGFDGYLLKPTNLNELLSMIESLIFGI